MILWVIEYRKKDNPYSDWIPDPTTGSVSRGNLIGQCRMLKYKDRDNPFMYRIAEYTRTSHD